MKWIIYLLVVSILTLTFYFILFKPRPKNGQPTSADNPNETGENHPKYRPVVMIIIDSMMDAPLREAMAFGKTPAMKFLSEHGHYYPQVVSSFPTMSVTIDSTLLTGSLPNQHGIFGLTYYHTGIQRLVNFGTGMRETFVFGLKQVLEDCLMNLNQRFLSRDVETIYEVLDVPAASINGLIFRGKKDHDLRPPKIASVLGLLPDQIPAKGPDWFSYGALAAIDPKSKPNHPFSRYGFHDRYSRNELVSLIKRKALPPFTLVYFPRNDEVVHRDGTSALHGLEDADRELQEVLNAFPSWEEAIQEVTFIVSGDSGQTMMIPNRKESYVNLRQLLKPYRIMPTRKKKPRDSDQIILAVNERSAYIYVHDPQVSIQEVVNQLKQEPKLDLIAWKENGWVHVESGAMEGKLEYRPGGDFRDEYGQTWELTGNMALMDLSIPEPSQIAYGMYPDGLMRLYGVMDTAERVIVVTVSPGYEMVSTGSPTHQGAAHGSLHQLDSLVPMIVCGTDSKPKHLRMVDMKDWIIDLVRANQTNENDEKRSTKEQINGEMNVDS